MRTGVITQKIGMTRLFLEDGRHVPVTVLKLDGCQVVAKRTEDRDGYCAVQLGSGFAKTKRLTQADRGRFAKAEVEPKKKLAEFRVDNANLLDVGDMILADHFVPASTTPESTTGSIACPLRVPSTGTLAPKPALLAADWMRPGSAAIA